MSRYRFPLAVLGTSLLLVLGLGVAGVLTVGTVLASGPFGSFVQFGGPFGGPFANHPIPPELQGLENLTPAERFTHFSGAQVSLKDKDDKPLVVNVTPGKVTAVSGTSLTLAANDGSTRTFALDDKTMVRGKPDPNAQSAKPTQVSLKQGDLVVVVTKNNEQLARAVMSGGTEGFGPRGGHGPWSR